jgi:hypothetical protein
MTGARSETRFLEGALITVFSLRTPRRFNLLILTFSLGGVTRGENTNDTNQPPLCRQ